MSAKTVVVTANKIKNRNKRYKRVKIICLIILLLLASVFAILTFIYNGGKFTITLDPNFSLETGIIMYLDSETKETKNILYASELDFMDNISGNWIPDNIHELAEGPHNGDNYIAYTFYIENQGEQPVSYWYQVEIDDVIKNVDEAVRIMIFRSGEKTVYAKKNGLTNQPEVNTKEFYSSTYAVLEQVRDFEPGHVDKFTIVIWLEGDDPDCTDNIIGGEIKMHMEITEEHTKK